MEKTVNQWLDNLEILAKNNIQNHKTEEFSKKLLGLKHNSEYKGYGVSVKVEIADELYEVMKEIE